MNRTNAHGEKTVRAAQTGAMFVLLAVCAGCSLSAAFIEMALPSDGGDGDEPDEQTCSSEFPLCPESDYAEVCDTLGTVVTDGEDGVPIYDCVKASEATTGPCDGQIGRLDQNVNSELRILHGFFLLTPEEDHPTLLTRCFRGRILVMPATSEEAEGLLSLSEVETAIDDRGIGAAAEMRIGLIDEWLVQDGYQANGLSAIELAFCVPDPTSFGDPRALAAMVRIGESTSPPRCLDAF